MLRNNHGLTITILVITVIIMLILAAVTMSININTNKGVELKTLVTNMEMIRTSAQGFSDRYKGIDDTKLPGTRETERGSINNVIGLIIGYTQGEDENAVKISPYWYLLDQDALNAMNVDIQLEGDERYMVDYENMEVVYVKSLELTDGIYPGIIRKSDKKVLYFYDQLKNVKIDDVEL